MTRTSWPDFHGGDEMTVCRFLFLCASATQRDDLLIDASGIGADQLTAESLPASDTALLVFKLAFTAEEAAMMNTSAIIFKGPDGSEISRIEGGYLPEWDGPITAASIVEYPFTVTRPGSHRFVLQVGGETVGSAPLEVILGPLDQ